MGSAILFNAARMQQIEDGTITSGLVDVNGDLILTRHDTTEVNAGHVRGEDGVDGDDGRSAYQVWLDAGNTGSVEDFLNSLKGVNGETGIPAGSILAWTAIAIPANWLECNGQAVDRDDYSDLFAIIGTQYGVGDGSTTFNVPDLRGRVITGYDSGQTEFNALGKQGGAKTHTLTISEMPSHTHIQNAHSHNPIIAVTNGGNASTYRSIFATNSPFWGYDANNAVQSTTATNQNTGGGDPHNNLQPYGTEKYIIKASGGIDTLSSTVESVLLGRVADVEDRVSDLEAVKPAFQARGTSAQSKSGTQSYSILRFPTEYADTTNSYDASTSRFTAPIDGTYEFSVSTCQSTAVGGPELALWKNGVSLLPTIAIGYSVAYMTFGATVVVELVAGDIIDVRWQNNNNTTVTMQGARSYFSGRYLG